MLLATEVQAGFTAFAGQYTSHEAYVINMATKPGFNIGLYLGNGYRCEIGGTETRLAGGDFSMNAFEEPTPTRLYRGERQPQKRCEIWLDPLWINSDAVERFDGTGTIRAALNRQGLTKTGTASSQMLSAASRLFAASSWDGPLSALRREAASLAFLAEAFADLYEVEQRSLPPVDLARMMRVKEKLDGLPPKMPVRIVDIAAQCNMSVRTLSRHFRLAFNSTVLEYVAGQRMDNARLALELDEMSIDQAAYIAGFAHRSNFSSAFRRRFGYTPGTARTKRS